MVHVFCQQLYKLLVNILVQNLPVHNAPSNHDHLRGNRQSYIQTQLCQIIPQNSPHFLLVRNLMKLCEINVQSLCNRFVTHHSFQARLMERTNTLKLLIFI